MLFANLRKCLKLVKEKIRLKTIELFNFNVLQLYLLRNKIAASVQPALFLPDAYSLAEEIINKSVAISRQTTLAEAGFRR